MLPAGWIPASFPVLRARRSRRPHRLHGQHGSRERVSMIGPILLALAPVALLVAFGHGLRRTGFIGDTFWPQAERCAAARAVRGQSRERTAAITARLPLAATLVGSTAPPRRFCWSAGSCGSTAPASRRYSRAPCASTTMSAPRSQPACSAQRHRARGRMRRGDRPDRQPDVRAGVRTLRRHTARRGGTRAPDPVESAGRRVRARDRDAGRRHLVPAAVAPAVRALGVASMPLGLLRGRGTEIRCGAGMAAAGVRRVGVQVHGDAAHHARRRPPARPAMRR